MSTLSASDVPVPESLVAPRGDHAPGAGPAPAPTPLRPLEHAYTASTLPLDPAGPTQRLVSLDAYRGLTMILMVSAGLQISKVVASFDASPDLRHLHTPFWSFLAYQTDHAPWVGCSLWDMIQPSFMFMVGAAVPFSIASRRAKGQSFGRMFGHAVVRAVALVLLGVFLMSNWTPKTNWTFDNVLTQIGLGYAFLFLLAWVKPRWQIAAAVAILAAYWAAFALYPKPPAELDLAKVGLPADWHRLGGFASHWEKHVNLGARVDQWFINLFPQARGGTFQRNDGGYLTLNFVPSLATMIFGLLAGELVRSRGLTARRKIEVMSVAGVAGLVIGWTLGALGICPVVKRIWTPSWAIFSAGWAFLILAGFYYLLDVAEVRQRLRKWAFPMVVVGMNSIAAYCISMLLKSWVRETMRRHLGQGFYEVPLGRLYAPMVEATVFLLFTWLVCWWMYRRKIFLRI